MPGRAKLGPDTTSRSQGRSKCFALAARRLEELDDYLSGVRGRLRVAGYVEPQRPRHAPRHSCAGVPGANVGSFPYYPRGAPELGLSAGSSPSLGPSYRYGSPRVPVPERVTWDTSTRRSRSLRIVERA
jgi:hypothetical protein